MTQYTLPELSYDYAALEPHISAAIMRLHHDKHHRAYVNNANAALEKLGAARQAGKLESLAALEHTLAFNISGHVLHSIFWRNLSPDGGGVPEGDLAQAITRDFGGFEKFKQELVQTATTITGSGWAALVWEPVSQRLATTQIHDHQSQVTQGSVPLLVLDAWEHAYYLQYQTEKARYFQAVWELWNWEDVSKRYAEARELDLCIAHTAQGAPPKAERTGLRH